VSVAKLKHRLIPVFSSEYRENYYKTSEKRSESVSGLVVRKLRLYLILFRENLHAKQDIYVNEQEK